MNKNSQNMTALFFRIKLQSALKHFSTGAAAPSQQRPVFCQQHVHLSEPLKYVEITYSCYRKGQQLCRNHLSSTEMKLVHRSIHTDGPWTSPAGWESLLPDTALEMLTSYTALCNKTCFLPVAQEWFKKDINDQMVCSVRQHLEMVLQNGDIDGQSVYPEEVYSFLRVQSGLAWHPWLKYESHLLSPLLKLSEHHSDTLICAHPPNGQLHHHCFQSVHLCWQVSSIHFNKHLLKNFNSVL